MRTKEYRVQNTEYRIQNTEYRVQNTEYRVQNTEYRVQNTEYRVQNTEYRIQNTEYRVQNTEYRLNQSISPKCGPGRTWLAVCLLSALAVLYSSCDPEAKWESSDVKVNMEIRTVSAGFAECSFSTNKDAYYLISIIQPWEDFNPMANQKQFMTLALDSAYSEYMEWRNRLLKNKEFNIAPFASHALQYGAVNHFFTGLEASTDYWIFAFPVDPKTMQPAGKLTLEPVRTADSSAVDVQFDYRVKGEWDYIYPIGADGAIFTRFPYVAATRDSLELNGLDEEWGVQLYFASWLADLFYTPDAATVYYGVKAIENDGENTHTRFEEGHTYYTAIGGYDFSFNQMAIYKFRWSKDCDFYFRSTDAANIFHVRE